ncbi:hypothetical protein [Nonomuraea typhae]|uniref:ABC transporter n=1 Tax=Nonomuraea typhae TaxID=2603600 RepID=A0ABW7YK32_9ACTN
MGSRQHLDDLARSARSLQDTVSELHTALTEGDEQGAGYARDHLAEQARRALGETGERGFEPGADAAGAGDVLAVAARDLALSEALFRAAEGEGGRPPDLERLRAAEDTLAGLAAALEGPVRRGFEPAAAASPDLPTAVANLRHEGAACLELICERSGGAVTGALVKLPVVGTLAAGADELLSSLGLATPAEQLTKWGVRLLEKALTLLYRLIPSDLLDRLRAAVTRLADGLTRDRTPGGLLMDAVLGADGLRRTLGARLDREALDRAKLDAARAELGGLGERFGQRMDLLSFTIAVSAGLVSTLVTPLAAGGVAALLLAVVVVLAADYADAWALPAAVRGVRTVVEEATA